MLVLIEKVHLIGIISCVCCFTVPWFVYEVIQCIVSECHVIWCTSHSSCAFSSSVLHYGYDMVLEKMVLNLLAAMWLFYWLYAFTSAKQQNQHIFSVCGYTVHRPVPTQTWQRPVTACICKPEAANRVKSSWWWAVCRLKHVEPLMNGGIINSITRVHVVGYFSWVCTSVWCTDQNQCVAK
jgi:hypothetical protein